MEGVKWQGRKAFEQRMKRAPSKLRRETRRNLKTAGTILGRAAQAHIKSQFPDGTGRLHSRMTVKSRNWRTVDTVSVGPAGKPSVYGRVHEFGMTVERKRGRYRKTPHRAKYRKRPWLKPAADQTKGQVVAIIGRSFRVV